MSFTKEHKVEIINTILRAIKEKKNPYNETLSFYKISRQTVYKYIKDELSLNDDDFEKFMSTCSIAIKNKEVMKAIKKLSR